jgi:hypothetical protein
MAVRGQITSATITGATAILDGAGMLQTGTRASLRRRSGQS